MSGPLWTRPPALLLLTVLLWVSPSSYGGELDPSFLGGLRYRLIGPFVGGRANTAAGVPNDPNVYYFGAAAGGVWKTTDSGTTWDPIFDDQPIAAIGSIAVSASRPDTIYVGTGEACFRTDVTHGNGVYKSTDAGKSWEHIGLEATLHIGQVVIHPSDPDTVFVAALGQAHGLEGTEDRGIYRTNDGGGNWEKVLYVNEKTGAIDVSMDPRNPQVLFAAMWEIHRVPWELKSGGPSSGLYRSTDGGSTWTKLSAGLPQGLMGKMGVAISPADSERVYALIEANEEERGMYRSDDGGETWKLVGRDHEILQRPWYFHHVTADTADPDVVYVSSVHLNKSIDGGATWTQLPQHHGDHHELWIAPNDPMRMIGANDGGANISINGGRTWTRSDGNQPTGQFYHVNTDDRFPYYVYGSMQDYITMALPSRSNGRQITHSDMYDVGGCEMGYMVPYPKDPEIVFASCTDGRLTRYDHRTGRAQRVDPWPQINIGHGAVDAKYRFNWVSPVVGSPHDPDVLYYGANVVLKTENGGQSWITISPDLTRDDETKQQPSGGPLTIDSIGPEYYNLIYTLVESPVQEDLLWVGTDDGLVQITRDGGRNWTNVTPDTMPEWSRVSLIDASPHQAGAAYVAVDRHQLNDFEPYIYKTSDFGATWTRITAGIPDRSFVRAVREDSGRRGLLFAGTETGLYVSLNDGESWQSLKLNLPPSPIHDLVVHEGDLVVGTHGRGLWILDDLSPLQQWSEALEEAPAHLFTPRTTYRVRAAGYFPLHLRDAGENPPPGVIIYYNLSEQPAQEATLTIVDAQGNTVRSFSGDRLPSEPGLHRFVWDMRYEGARRVPGAFLYDGSLLGPLAVPGDFEAKLSVDGSTHTQSFRLEPDPRVDVSLQELELQLELHTQIRDSVSALAETVIAIRDTSAQLTEVEDQVDGDTKDGKAIERMTRELLTRLGAIEESITEKRLVMYADAFHYGIALDNKLAHLMDIVGQGADSAPSEQASQVYEELWAKAQSQIERLKTLLDEELPPLNERLSEFGLTQIDPTRSSNDDT